MLISNALPQVSAPQSTSVAATQASLAAATAASASKTQISAAVIATPAAAGYLPQLPDQRRSTTATSNNTTSTASDADGRPAILPDPEFWRVPDREVNRQLVQQQVQQAVRNPVETVQQTTAFAAQVAAQELPQVKSPRSQEEPVQTALPGTRKPAALIGKKSGIGDTSGFGAYAISSARTVAIDFPAAHEAVA